MKKVIIDEAKIEREFLSDYQIMKQAKLNNVIKERVELYRDFVINLIHYIHTTYLGKEFIKTEEDVKGHYNWAFNKVLSDFEKEGVIFTESIELRAYFYEYFHTRFYSAENIPSLKTFLDFWENIFILKANKEKTVMSALMEIYKLFDNAFNNKIILEKML
jgi:hypothetical protein